MPGEMESSPLGDGTIKSPLQIGRSYRTGRSGRILTCFSSISMGQALSGLRIPPTLTKGIGILPVPLRKYIAVADYDRYHSLPESRYRSRRVRGDLTRQRRPCDRVSSRVMPAMRLASIGPKTQNKLVASVCATGDGIPDFWTIDVFMPLNVVRLTTTPQLWNVNLRGRQTMHNSSVSLGPRADCGL